MPKKTKIHPYQDDNLESQGPPLPDTNPPQPPPPPPTLPPPVEALHAGMSF